MHANGDDREGREEEYLLEGLHGEILSDKLIRRDEMVASWSDAE